MATNKKAEVTDLVPTAPSLLAPEDVRELSQFFEAGFEEDKTILVGNPQDNKIPVFFGELLGSGGQVLVETPGSKADPVTGEVPTSALNSYIFNPIEPRTMTPWRKSTYTVIAPHQIDRQCTKLLTLAKAKEEESGKKYRVQLLIRYNGTIKTRKGNQLNDFSFLHRFIELAAPEPAPREGFEKSGTGA